MNNKFLKMAVAGLVMSVSGFANAVFIFSVDSYTASSITFTIDGDMSGYTVGSESDLFGLIYNGDIWAGNRFYGVNNFSDSVFDNVTPSGGNTGTFGGTRAYTWTSSSIAIAAATANMNQTTLSWNRDLLNTSASNWSVDLVQGNGFASTTINPIEVLASFGSTSQATVPEPSTLAILGLSLMGLAVRRFKEKA